MVKNLNNISRRFLIPLKISNGVCTIPSEGYTDLNNVYQK